MIIKHDSKFKIHGFDQSEEIDAASLGSFSVVGVHEHLIIAVKAIQSLNERLKNIENKIQLQSPAGGAIMSELDEVKQLISSLENRLLNVEVKVENAVKGEIVKVESALVKVSIPLEVKIRAFCSGIKSKLKQILLNLADKLK